MAINIAHLFARLGKVFGGVVKAHDAINTTVLAREAAIRTQYASASPTLPSVLDGLADVYTNARQMSATYTQALFDLAGQTLIDTVEVDRGLSNVSLSDALDEVYYQFSQANRFNDCPGTLTLIADPLRGANVGNPLFLTNSQDETGAATDYLIPDVARIKCTFDEGDGSTNWQETFEYRSKTGDASALDPAYPNGAGLVFSFSLIDPATDGGQLADGVFAEYASAAFTKWERGSGITSSQAYQAALTAADPRGKDGTALVLKGDGSVVPRVLQKVTLEGASRYAFVLYAKTINRPTSTDRIRVSLRNGTTNALLTDDAGNSLELSAQLAATPDTFAVRVSGWFVTPRVLPDSVKLDIRISGAASASTAAANLAEVQITYCSLQPASPLYPRGLSLVGFSGTTATLRGDAWQLTTALSSGSVSDYYIRWMDRAFGVASYPQKWPTDAATNETIADSGIS